MGIIVEAIFHFVAEVIFFYTGEITRTIFTLGRHQIQPNFPSVSKQSSSNSICLGLLVWLSFLIGTVVFFSV